MLSESVPLVYHPMTTWGLGNGFPCKSLLKNFGRMFEVRFMHMDPLAGKLISDTIIKFFFFLSSLLSVILPYSLWLSEVFLPLPLARKQFNSTVHIP